MSGRDAADAMPGPQPPIAELTADGGVRDADLARARAIIAEYLHLEGPLLPILHALQAAFGHVPDWVRAPLADALNISRADLHGVITFYHDFRKHPAGRHVLKLCRAEACQAMGAAAQSAALLQRLGLDWHGTTPDGRLTVEPAFCLGLCACAPAALYDGAPLGRVDRAMLDRLAVQP